MEKRSEHLEVKTMKDGMIELRQGDGFHDEDVEIIRIHVDQVEQVIKWLKEAKTELKGGHGIAKSVKLTGV